MAAVCLAACSPVFDWREVRPEGSELLAMFPCKPDRHERSVPLGAGRVSLEMLSCSAGGSTFALSRADVGDPTRVAEALAALRAATVGNIGGTPHAQVPVTPAGATPNDQAGRVRIDGRMPGGEATSIDAAFFARGTAVFQASVVGAALDPQALETYFAGFKFGV